LGQLEQQVGASRCTPCVPGKPAMRRVVCALQVADACTQLQRCGFINYFGLQRFGTAGVPTHRCPAGGYE
jgi:hypothetical protein